MVQNLMMRLKIVILDYVKKLLKSPSKGTCQRNPGQEISFFCQFNKKDIIICKDDV